MIAPTTSDIFRDWDAIVVGAGPAGSIAAREFARRGCDVLLVDKTAFPRAKVCGCCLNRNALDTLHRLGLGALPASLGATPLRALTVVSLRGRLATLPLSGGCSVSRERLDAALIQEAIAAGAHFLPVCPATIGETENDYRTVQLRGSGTRARVVIAADGLAGTSLSKVEGFEPRITARSRIGIGAVVDRPPPAFARGAITMICGRHGYVGAVWIEGNRLDIAGAVDPAWLKSVGGPQVAVSSMFADAGIDAGLSCAWRGTPALTRRRRVEADRLLVIGDAAGYVEPFTGEGMAWAMAGAEAAAEFASETILRRTVVTSVHAAPRSRVAATVTCQGRKPLEASGNQQALKGRHEGQSAASVVSPPPGLKFCTTQPGAHAPGKLLSPLRGWSVGEAGSCNWRDGATSSWTSIHRSLVAQGQRECRWLAGLLRSPAITTAAIRILAAMPLLASPIVRRINHGRGPRGHAASEGIA